MGGDPPQTTEWAERFPWLDPLLVCALALLLVGARAAQFEFPPDNDQAYYLCLARNLAAGRGLEIDIVQHYFLGVPELPRAACDYWMPFSAVLMAPFVAVDGSYGFSVVPGVLWTAVTAVLVSVLARRVLESRPLGVACGVLYALHPAVRFYGGTSDSSTLGAGLILGAFLLMDDVLQEKPRAELRAAGAGALVGLTALTRADAVATLGLTLLVTGLVLRVRGLTLPSRRHMGWFFLGAALLVVPWSLRAMLTFGTPWNPAGSRGVLVSVPDQAYRVDRPATFSTFWAYFSADPLEVVRLRLGALWVGLKRVFAYLTGYPLLTPLTLFGAVVLARARRPLGILLTVFAFAVPTAYAVLLERLGTNGRTWACVIAVVILWALTSLAPATWANWKRAQRFLPLLRYLRVLLMGLAVCFALSTGLSNALWPRSELPNHAEAASYAALERYLNEAQIQDPIVAVQPCQLSYGTGRRAYLLPRGTRAAILGVARSAGARHFYLSNDAALLAPGGEPGLEIYMERDPEMVKVFQHGRWKLFRWDDPQRTD